jgi:hypothetical protein
MTPSISVILVAGILARPPVAAQTSSASIPETVKTGMNVSVVDDQGRKIDGRVDGVSEHAVRVSVRGEIKEIPIDQIVRIDRPDSIKNGALIGLGIGVGLGLIGGAADPQGRNQRGRFLFWSAVGNGVILTGLGTLIDAVFDNRRTLYERGGRIQVRVSPVVERGVRAVAVAFNW